MGGGVLLQELFYCTFSDPSGKNVSGTFDFSMTPATLSLELK